MKKSLWILAGVIALMATMLSAGNSWVGHTYRVNVASAKAFQMTFTVQNSNTVSIKGNKFGRSSNAEVSNVVVKDDRISFDVKFGGSACGPGSSGTMTVFNKKQSGNSWGSWVGLCAKRGKKFRARVAKLKLIQ